MIDWPPTETLDEIAESQIARLQETAVALQLQEDEATWKLASWPRTDEPPARFLLRDEETHEEVVVYLERDGTWTQQRRS